MKNDPMMCRATGCSRKLGKFGDLVCPAHWKLVPRDLKQLLLKKLKTRDHKNKQRDAVAAAGLVVAYLETLLIQLPPESP